MIQANDLRIGNKIIVPDDGMITIEGVLNGKVWRQVNSVPFNYLIDDCEPIPLTSEILEKCGFEKDWTDNLVNGKYYISENINKEYVFNIEINDERILEIKVIKYLHQLQNLYYVLTGQELEVHL